MNKFIGPSIYLMTGLVFLVGILFAGQAIFEKTYPFPKEINYGVTFSPKYARYLGIDWKEIFLKSLDELKVREYRISTQWDLVEKDKGKFDFQEVDYMLSELEKRDARTIMVVGFRQPRWPECHFPEWAKDLSISVRQDETLKYIEKVVQRYKDKKAIWAFQVENEPLLPFFGEDCPMADSKFLKKEVEKVRSMTDKTIIVTDSGEFGLFITPMQLSDIFGTTLYRKTYDPIFKYKTYPILPYLYNLKSFMARNIFARNNQKTIIVELQAEPWLSDAGLAGNPTKQAEFFPLKELQNIVLYAKKTGFNTQYLWGVEWWYWMSQNGHPEYLEYAKGLYKK